MAWILRNTATHEVWTGSLENKYGLLFHGVKFWEDGQEAKQQATSFLSQQGIENPAAWEIVEVDEAKLKIFNVRLNNNAANKLYWTADGSIEVK